MRAISPSSTSNQKKPLAFRGLCPSNCPIFVKMIMLYRSRTLRVRLVMLTISFFLFYDDSMLQGVWKTVFLTAAINRLVESRDMLSSRNLLNYRAGHACTVQSVSAIAYPFDFRDFITITDASLYAIRSIFFFFRYQHMKGKEILPTWRFDK